MEVLKSRRTNLRRSSTEILKSAESKLKEIEEKSGNIKDNNQELQVLINDLSAFVTVYDSYIRKIESINSDLFNLCSSSSCSLTTEEIDKLVADSEDSLRTAITSKEMLRHKVEFWSRRVDMFGAQASASVYPTIPTHTPSPTPTGMTNPYYDPGLPGKIGNVKFSSNLPNFANDECSQTTNGKYSGKSNVVNNVKLDKIKLPTFDGTLTEYRYFMDSFTFGVHNQNIPEIHKLQYLMSYLRGPAKDAISGIQMTSENYSVALHILQERFGNEQLIVNEFMDKLNNITCKSPSLPHLQEFYDQIMINIRSLEAIDILPRSYEFMLIPSLMKRIPDNLKIHIVRSLGKGKYGLNDLMTSFENELYFLRHTFGTSADDNKPVMSTMLTPTQQPTSKQPSGNPPKGNQNQGNSGKVKKSKFKQKPLECVFCNGNHYTDKCDNISDINRRWEFVKSQKLCLNCLSKKHFVDSCQSKKLCRICNSKHHTALHTSPPNGNGNPSTNLSITSNLEPSTDNHTASRCTLTEEDTVAAATLSSKGTVLLKTALITAVSRSTSCETYSLFDGGAMRTYITQKLSDRLELQPVMKEELKLAKFGSAKSDAIKEFDIVILQLLTDEDQLIKISATVVPIISVPLSNDADPTAPHLKNLKLANRISPEKFEVSLLIGSDHYWKFVGGKVIKGFPCALETKFGYVLSGPTSPDIDYNTLDSPTTLSTMLSVIERQYPEQELISKFCDLESIGIKDSTSLHNDEKEISIKDFSEHSVTYKDGRYHVKLPFKEDPKNLSSNYNLCLKRTRSSIRTLARKPELLKQYDDIIKDQLSRGFIEYVPKNELSKTENVYYIPHHGVKKETSTTTKLRIVYDCSCHEPNQLSLNDILEQGPALQLDLTSLLLRFRLFENATCSDLEKAFLNVGLDESCRDLTRFLWLSDKDNINSKLDVLRFTRLLFGPKPSPFLLNCTIYTHLLKLEGNTARMLLNSVYVDNFINSFYSKSSVMEYYSESREIMAKAGFNLRSWSSNYEKIMEQATIDGCQESETQVTVLGMKWDIKTDQLSFKSSIQSPQPTKRSKTITKREVMKTVGKIYDPLGLLNPTVLNPKYFLQKLWKLKTSWDNPIPNNMLKEWFDIQYDLCKIGDIKFARNLNVNPNEVTELHIFCDASKIAYSSVGYIKSNQDVNVFYAKNRLAPVKANTIPRLELLGAFISIRLAEHIKSSLNPVLHDIQVFYWCDSQVVIYWINTTKKLSRFISNRVKSIRDGSDPNQWRYCPSKENPADLSTRGSSLADLNQNKLWWKGPEWLLSGDWPTWSIFREENLTEDEIHEVNLEIVCEEISLNVTSEYASNVLNIFIPERRPNSWFKLLRILAYVIRFTRKVRKLPTNSSHITIPEFKNAEYLIIRDTQRYCFETEFVCLVDRPNAKKPPQLVKQLSLFLDDKNLIRSCGRIHNADLPYDAKFPILLPKKFWVSKCIVEFIHQLSIHSKMNFTLVLLRQRFWIPQGRQYVKSVLSKCTVCKKVDGKSYPVPPAPPLPKDRVLLSRPYEVTGVDYTGEMHVIYDGKDIKVYILLFTCTVIRHVHLEVVKDMTTSSFLLAFRRFCSKRYKPRKMISDNAQSFISASEVLSLNDTHAQITNEGVDWQFIPKRAPWQGGFWERMVGIVKTCLKKAIGRKYVTYEEFITIVSEVECAINDRPLTYVNDEVGEVNPLTPSELYCGRRNITLPFHSDDYDPNDVPYAEQLQERYLSLTSKIKELWQRWRKDYLTSLRQHHSKYGTTEQQIQVGDVVLVDGENFSRRLFWKLGIVTSLNRGNDGIVRSVELKIGNKTTSRPIQKLYPLEVRDEKFAQRLIKPTLTPNERPQRKAAQDAFQRIRKINAES